MSEAFFPQCRAQRQGPLSPKCFFSSKLIKSKNIIYRGVRRLLRVSWIARSNQSIRKEINPEYSLEGLTLKLRPPDMKSRLIGKDPDAGKE